MRKGKLSYDPSLHYNHGKPWTLREVEYLCGMIGFMKYADISLALGRTQKTCETKVYDLRRMGEFNNYKEKFKLK